MSGRHENLYQKPGESQHQQHEREILESHVDYTKRVMSKTDEEPCRRSAVRMDFKASTFRGSMMAKPSTDWLVGRSEEV
jgi:hypothetical protein